MLELNSDCKGTWFYFDPDDPSKGGVRLREITTDEHLRIERMTVTKKRKFKRGSSYEESTTDEKLASKLQWEFCIVEWNGVSIDGNEVECTPENIARAMKIINFVKIIVDGLEELTETNTSLKEARVKNLKPTSRSKTVQQTAESA